MAAKSSRDRPIKDYKKLHEEGFGESVFSPAGSPVKSAVQLREPELHSGEPVKSTSAKTAFETERDELRQQLQKLREEQELRRLREEVQAAKKDLHRPVSRGDEPKPVKGKIFSLDNLRQDAKLRSRAQKELSKLGLFACDSSDEDSDEESKLSNAEKGEDRKVKKSGISAKASDFVSRPQMYPHSHLRFEFVNNSIEFDKLDLNLFVAGELEIISQVSISSTEKFARLELLKRLMYLNNAFEFSVIKSLYAAILREIELGYRKWGDDFMYIENAILTSHCNKFKPKTDMSQGSSAPFKAEEKLWFCAKFQRNKCPQKDSHTIQVKGRTRFAKHICASCWQKDKKEWNHPECSSACPHYTL